MPRPASPSILSPGELERVGFALYGSQWQTTLAADLDMSARQVRRLAAGDSPVTEAIARHLLRICISRGEALVRIADTVLLPKVKSL